MGNIFCPKKNTLEPPKQSKKPNENDQVILKTKLQRDKIKAKRQELQRQVGRATEKARELMRSNQKQEAIYYLGKKKQLEQSLKGVDTKLSFLQSQIDKVEQAMDDVEFTNTIKESNKLMKEMMDKLDIDVVREANELDAEINTNNEEIMKIINDNLNDEDIMEEYEKLGGDKEEIVNEVRHKAEPAEEKQEREVAYA